MKNIRFTLKDGTVTWSACKTYECYKLLLPNLKFVLSVLYNVLKTSKKNPKIIFYELTLPSKIKLTSLNIENKEVLVSYQDEAFKYLKFDISICFIYNNPIILLGVQVPNLRPQQSRVIGIRS